VASSWFIFFSYHNDARSNEQQTSNRLRVFENRVLWKIMGPNREQVTGEWRRLRNGELMACTPHQILFGWSKQEEWDGRGTWHLWGRGAYRVL